MRPYLIGIAGPSGSGKTEIARRLAYMLDAPILSLDHYYRDASHLPFEERARINFDEPRALDHELLSRQLALLAEGQEIAVPVYDFTRHVRAAETHRIPAAGFVIIEGIFALYWKEVRGLLSTRVFVEVPDEIGLARRIGRDVRERGRTAASVIEQYAATVRPMAELYVLPTREFAHVRASGVDPLDLSVQAVLAHVREQREDRSKPESSRITTNS
jgi:uridine kinase